MAAASSASSGGAKRPSTGRAPGQRPAISRCNAASAGVGLRHISYLAIGQPRDVIALTGEPNPPLYERIPGSSSAARSGQGGRGPSEQTKSSGPRR